ncbi:MAG: GMC family oxidoreductase [Alphaproteobacteria bacterium]|nr:GMC family oxidoreductase [Alphaproteobacteria bacterium]
MTTPVPPPASPQRRFKALVIGSGAGGAPAATALAEAWGEGVALLEAGPHLHARDFTQVEREMVPRLYAQGGVQGTEDGVLSLLQARTVGGSTVINDALCFRPPPELDARWKALGAHIDTAALAPFVDRVEEVLQVREIRRDQINRANYLVGLGAARLGWHGERLRHNSVGCVQCGFRHLGCAYDAKQSMNLSFVPRAQAAGAQLLPEVEVHHLERRGGAWVALTSQGAFAAEHVVLCAGVVQTPTILLRSGIAAGDGVQVHVQTVAWGDFDDPVDGFNGIPMAYGVLEFADIYGHTGPGYLIEGVAVQPLGFSVQPQLEGLGHDEVLGRYRHLSGAVSLVRSASRGRITLKDDRPAITYPLVEADLQRLAHFYDRATELYLAAGASRVLLAHRHVGWVDRVTPVPTMDPGTFYVYTAHPFGGAGRGLVTDEVGRVPGQPGLWVLDGSAVPEAIGVNPQVTIAALALEGAARLIADA